jgi:hypothetical protein
MSDGKGVQPTSDACEQPRKSVALCEDSEHVHTDDEEDDDDDGTLSRTSSTISTLPHSPEEMRAMSKPWSEPGGSTAIHPSARPKNVPTLKLKKTTSRKRKNRVEKIFETFQDDVDHYCMLVAKGTHQLTEGVRDFFGVSIPNNLNDTESGVNTGLNVLAVKLLPTIGIFHRSNVREQIKEPESHIVAFHR